MELALDHVVPGLENTFGRFHRGSLSLRGEGTDCVEVFHQVLDAKTFHVSFEPGSTVFQLLSNDQNRFSPPRSLPPILALAEPQSLAPDRAEAIVLSSSAAPDSAESYVITRYAYSEDAFQLLHDLIAGGHIFSLHDFVHFTYWMAHALDFLHSQGVSQGQWNARSVFAVPVEPVPRADGLPRGKSYRYEVFNTGVYFRDPADVPQEYIDRGYYPAETLVAAAGNPDYGALDLESDVYCFAAFLKDLLQRACSSEELTAQSARINEALLREANRRGWKASPEKLRQKELEILDYLYTVKVKLEALVQEGLRPRERRAHASEVFALAKDLREKSDLYLERLFECGFEEVNVFDDSLQHYTAFEIRVNPTRVSSFEDSTVHLSGMDLPQDLVRVTLNDRDQGVQVIAAENGGIDFRLARGFPAGHFKVTINNRRTNGVLEVFSPEWQALDPSETHQPWAGFGDLSFVLRGENLPSGARYSLRDLEGEEHDAIAVRRRSAEGPGETESPPESLELVFDSETAPNEYELCANGLPTGLPVTIHERLPEPRVDALEEEFVLNHCDWALTLRGRNFHPAMLLDMGEKTPAGFAFVVEGEDRATLTIPRGFPAGEHTLRVNYQDSDVILTVVQPRWQNATPANFTIRRSQSEPTAIVLRGTNLPLLRSATEEIGYQLHDRRGHSVERAIVDVEEITEGEEHRLLLSPSIGRGRPTLAFGEQPTGVGLTVRRQLPRSAVAGIWLLMIAILGGTGLWLEEHFAPRLTSVEPGVLFARGDTLSVEVAGAYLAEVELLRDGAESPRLPVEEVAPGRYRVRLVGIDPGEYRLRPHGPLYSRPATEHVVRVVDPALACQPTEIHRLRGAAVTLSAHPEFPIEEIGSLELRKVGATAEDIRLTIDLEGGKGALSPDQLARMHEGVYELYSNDRKLRRGEAPLSLAVVGPNIESVDPPAVTISEYGEATIGLSGQHLLPELAVALAPTGTRLDDREIRLLPATEGYSGTVEPGVFDVGWVLPSGEIDWDESARLRVLPRPTLTQVFPLKLDPGVPTTLEVSGLNLPALDGIRLRPIDGDGELVSISLDAAEVTADDEVRGSAVIAGVTAVSGTYRVEPAESEIVVQVFDDCRDPLALFRDEGEGLSELLLCLADERPSAELVLEVAELCFDRGYFSEARALYAGSDELRARFRAAFVDQFVAGQVASLSLTEKELSTDYGNAAARLGWVAAEGRAFAADAVLPWELEFVRGVTTDDQFRQVEAFQLSLARQERAAKGFGQEFTPARKRLARAWLAVGEKRLSKLEVAEAERVLAEEVLATRSVWDHLQEDERAWAHFLLGHIALWYRGDVDVASASLEQARTTGSGSLAAWSGEYLAAIRLEELTPEGEGAEEKPLRPANPAPASFAGGSPQAWFSAFVEVYRYRQDIAENPNYNILTERYDFDVYLPQGERKKSRAFHKALRALEAIESPFDPFAHQAVIYHLRNAQRIAWPNQEGGAKAPTVRGRLEALPVSSDLVVLREYYLLLGDLGPLEAPQLAVLPREEIADLAARIDRVEKDQGLPPALVNKVKELKEKLQIPNVLGSTQ